jgi:hypothetical protein
MNLISDAISALNQAGLIIGGLVLLAIGGVILGDHFYWRAKSVHVVGKIRGFRTERARPVAAEGEEPAAKPPARRPLANMVEVMKKHPLGGILGLFFAAAIYGLPLALIGIGIFRIEKYAVLKLTGQRAEAVVVRNETRSAKGGTNYMAVIDFTDQQGRSWEVKDGFAKGGSPIFADGTRLAVFYDPGDPTRFVIDNALYWPGLGLALVAVGGLVLLLMTKAFSAATSATPAKLPFAAEGCYYPVYEYAAPDGHVQVAESDSGSSDLADKEPGKTVSLLVRPDKPREAREVGHMWLALALGFLAGAAVFFFMAFGSFRTSLLTFVALGGFVLVGLSQTLTHRQPRSAWKRDEPAGSGLDEGQLRRAATPLLNHDDWAARMRWRDATYRKWLPVYLLMPLVLLGAGYYTGQSTADMVSKGTSARGSIVRFEGERGSKGTMYHAIARFHDAAGRTVEFRDAVGASTPIGRTGDSVAVLYMASNPVNAIIDRGLWNWLVPVLCTGGGLFVLFLTLKCYLGIRSRAV